MNHKDNIKIVVVLVLFSILGYMIHNFIKKSIAATAGTDHAIFRTSSPVQRIVGGDKDEHGCLGSAGYTWCEEKEKCIRLFEESCSLR